MEKQRSKRRKSTKISRRRKTRFSTGIEKRNAHLSVKLEDAPEAIQRFFNSFGDTEWGSNLEAKDVLAVLNSGGQLSARALSELSGVRMITAHGEALCANSVTVEVKSNEDARLFENILDALGPNLRTVALDYEFLRTFVVRRLEERCARVSTVIITDMLSEFDLSKLLQQCGTNLRKLDLQGNRLRKSHVNAIENLCTNLIDLRIAYSDWNPRLLTWKNIGETLEALTITCPIDFLENRSSQSETLTAILRNCTRLTHIEIEYPMYEDFSFVVAFCTLLGERLLSLKIKTCGTFMTENDASKIFKACPNTTFDGNIWLGKRPVRLEQASSLPNLKIE